MDDAADTTVPVYDIKDAYDIEDEYRPAPVAEAAPAALAEMAACAIGIHLDCRHDIAGALTIAQKIRLQCAADFSRKSADVAFQHQRHFRGGRRTVLCAPRELALGPTSNPHQTIMIKSCDFRSNDAGAVRSRRSRGECARTRAGRGFPGDSSGDAGTAKPARQQLLLAAESLRQASREIIALNLDTSSNGRVAVCAS